MKHAAATLLLGATLMACSSSSNPFSGSSSTTTPTTGTGTTTTTPTTPTTPADPTVPTAIAGEIGSFTYDATAGTLTITGSNLDNVPLNAEYTRAPGLDQNGYLAFTTQADSHDRHFTAYVQQSGDVRAATISSPGPRNRSFMGAYFDRDGEYDPPEVTPTTGLVSYAGRYIGVANMGDPNGSDLISTTVGDPELQPSQALTVKGDIFLNADFADNTVEGNIYNRELVNTDLSTNTALPSLVLIAAPIDATGRFAGNVEYDIRDPASNTTDFVDVGDFAGTFGGADAAQVAGGVALTEFDGSNDPLLLEGELETGIFVLDQCGTAGASALCP